MVLVVSSVSAVQPRQGPTAGVVVTACLCHVLHRDPHRACLCLSPVCRASPARALTVTPKAAEAERPRLGRNDLAPAASRAERVLAFHSARQVDPALNSAVRPA